MTTYIFVEVTQQHKIVIENEETAQEALQELFGNTEVFMFENISDETLIDTSFKLRRVSQNDVTPSKGDK